LYSLQSKILQDLANANPDTILDNNALIDNLEVSKLRSQTIKENLEEAQQVEVVINKTRNFYRSVAERGSILYFSITDMSGIN
jgi:dynein heavy chain